MEPSPVSPEPTRGPEPLDRAVCWLGWALVLAAVVCATLARIAIRHAGPDVDSDGVRHASIASMVALDWRNAQVHWVWLPGWHFIGALFVRAGGGIEHVRTVNTILGALPPVVLTRSLQLALRACPLAAPWMRTPEQLVPYVAGALLALSPIGLVLGASAQPEVLFQLVILGACMAHQAQRFVATGLLLTVAVLLRYEAWVLLPVFAGLDALRRPRRAPAVATWALPMSAIVAWTLWHRDTTHEWLQFLRVNREYVRDAHARYRFPWAVDRGVIDSLLRYTWRVPESHVLGSAIVLVVPGLAWVAQRTSRVFRSVFTVLLAFVTYAWVRRLHLGLARHAFATAPLFAVAAAATACVLPAWLARRLARNGARMALLAAITGGLAVLGSMAFATSLPAYRYERARCAAAYRVELRVAAVLRAQAGPSAGKIYCDEAMIEIFSELAPERMDRSGDAYLTPYHVRAGARRYGFALVATAAERARALRPVMRTVYEEGPYVVLRLDATDLDAR